MSEIVPADEIEKIVGVPRDSLWHYARAVSAEQTVYILHSLRCLEKFADLRECPYSLVLDNGIDTEEWVQDAAVLVTIRDGVRLIPRSVEGGVTP